MKSSTEDHEKACENIGKAWLCKDKLENARKARKSKEKRGNPMKI